ncbi:MAG: hypothetical protein H6621_06935 [Halobacteriovoraceae bacterium]|nr:hypothetical protein [Halobacteriovoraceae bacterium]
MTKFLILFSILFSTLGYSDAKYSLDCELKSYFEENSNFKADLFYPGLSDSGYTQNIDLSDEDYKSRLINGSSSFTEEVIGKSKVFTLTNIVGDYVEGVDQKVTGGKITFLFYTEESDEEYDILTFTGDFRYELLSEENQVIEYSDGEAKCTYSPYGD